MLNDKQDPREIGRRDARSYQKHPERLRELRLSHYNQGPTVPRILRALLLSLPRSDRLVARMASNSRSMTFWRQLADDVTYWAGVREGLSDARVWRRLRWNGVPILMYHRVVPTVDHRDPKYAISWARFDAQMWLLARLGYKSLSLAQVVEAHRSGELLPPKSVVITFDDGYKDNLLAVALMRRYGMSGIIFLTTRYIGGWACWRYEELGQVPMLSCEQARQLAHEGIEFGAHSVTHPRLAELSMPDARHEIATSKQVLERELGEEIYFFAYPFGSASAETKQLAAEASFSAACGISPGLSTMHDDLMYLRRITVYGKEGLASFLLRLWLGDNPFDYLPWGRKGRWRRQL